MARFVALVLIVLSSSAAAADRPLADQLLLKNGMRLRGLVFERTPQTFTLLVSDKWLRTAQPKLHESIQAKTADSNKAALNQLIARLRTELTKRDGPPAVTGFLKEQLDTAEAELNELANQPNAEFLWWTLPSRDVERIDAGSVEHRQLLAWAWNEDLDRAELRSADEVTRELKGRAVSPIGWPLPWIERLPAREQSADEWAARLAIVEFAFDKPLHFQGTGDVLIRADKPDQFNIAQILGDLLRQQLQLQLGDLLGDPQAAKRRDPKQQQAAIQAGLAKVARVADAEPANGFRVTRLDMANDLQQANVVTQFVVKLPNGSWQTIFQDSEQTDTKQARPDIQQRIEADPRVKQVVELTRQLGGAADDTIQQALRFGAATMAAQKNCDRDFAAFRELYLRSLARPQLIWPSAPQPPR